MQANHDRHDLFGVSEHQQVVIIPNQLAAEGRHLCNSPQKPPAQNIVVNKAVCGQYRFQHGWSAGPRVLYKLQIGNNKYFHVENCRVGDKMHVSLGVSPEMKFNGLEWELYAEVDVGAGRIFDVLINSKIDNDRTSVMIRDVPEDLVSFNIRLWGNKQRRRRRFYFF